MIWNRPSPRELMTRAERARRLHEAWLNLALARLDEMPEVPARRSDRGGFDHLHRSAHGRRVSEAWWTRMLEQISRLLPLPGD